MGVATPSINRSRRRSLLFAAAAVVVVIVLIGVAATLYTEALWFQELRASRVFSTKVWTQVGLFAVFGGAFVVLLLANIWVARRITSPGRALQIPDQILQRYRATARPYARRIAIAIALLVGAFIGARAAGRWREYQLWRHSLPFGSADPVFGRDLSFFVFKVPFLRFVFGWGVTTLLILLLTAFAAHYVTGGIRPQRRGERFAPEARAHLSALAGALVLLKAWGYRLDQYNLLFSRRGAVAGASYTDVHAQLPILRGLGVVAIISAALLLANVRFRNWFLPVAAFTLVGFTAVIGAGIFPAALQRLKVKPNERTLEQPYIQRNIRATREGFGIDDVAVRPHPATGKLDARGVRSHASTIDNIRLWSPDVLRNVYLNLQRIKQYYQFVSPADADRYVVGGAPTQVMIGAREISPNGLSPDAKTWVNTHLFYTHGYGAVSSRVDRAVDQGQPAFLLKNIPPVPASGAPTLRIAQLYYGENEEVPFVVVNTKQEELDHPTSDRSGGAGYVTNRYEGAGGIEVGGFFRRAAFAVRFRDLNLLISGAITGDSRLMFRRQVYDRVSKVAPFVTLENDPYIAIVDGRLVWIVDGYTTSSWYPYAQPANFGGVSGGLVAGSGNYIRGSVKFVVDAKDGTVAAYAWDESDPILRAWMRIFPGLVRPRSEIPGSVLAHIRYPQGLFQVQSDRLADYHVTDAGTLYQKEDAWLVARDPTACLNAAKTCRSGAGPPVSPYYMLAGLPGETGSHFVLVRPFTPAGGDRQNMVAYLAAVGDAKGYGTLTTYEFPRSQQVFGPEQAQAAINQDPAVSQQVSLWNQQHSKVIYGDLLIVPVGDALLYVQPLYLRGEGSQIPELKRVVAFANGTVEMGDSLAEVLARLTR